MYFYTGTVTQSSDADASIGLTITPQRGQYLDSFYYWILAGNYAAGRTISLDVRNASSNVIVQLETASLDNQSIIGPELKVEDGATSSETSLLVGTVLGLIIGSRNVINLRGASLLENETIKIEFYSRIRGNLKSLPTVASIGTNVAISADTEVLY